MDSEVVSARAPDAGTDAEGSGALFDELLADLPVGVIVVGPDGRIAAFNPAAEQIFEVTAARAIGRSLIESVRNAELDQRLMAALRQGSASAVELTHLAGERRLQVSVRPVARADGSHQAIIVVVDLTRLRELEAIRRDFVSNVSHDLRTPLTAIKIMVEALQSGVDEPARQKFLADIARETERMIALVEDLLDLARLESGRLELKMAPVDLGALTRRVAAAHETQARELGVRLEALAPDRPAVVIGDQDKLYQVVTNLVDNAVRNTPEGGRVTLKSARNGSQAHIEVTDTGFGIPADAMPHVFDRFYVVDRSRARQKSGTGLGLAIVKHIVELHGGTVSATSELNVGSTFRCTFPI